MVIAILARVSVHAFSTVVAVLFGLGFTGCGSSVRTPTDAGSDRMGAADTAPDVDIDVDADDVDVDVDVGVIDGPALDAPADVIDTDAGTGDAADAAHDAPEPDGAADDAAPDVADYDVSPPTCGACAAGDWGTPSPLGTLPAVQLSELSGLASSHLHPRTLYAHNDSGDSARFFAIDDSARLLAQVTLPNVLAVDWEDIAVGRCPAGWCVYIADIGDNDLNRTECNIYRVPEPQPLPTDGSTITSAYERLPFVYPDGLHNSETLLVEPQSQRIFVVTKETTTSARVYELPPPLTPNVRATLVFVGSLSVPATGGPVTGGDFSACGDRMLIRSRTAM